LRIEKILEGEIAGAAGTGVAGTGVAGVDSKVKPFMEISD